MAGSALPNASLLAAIERLKAATAKLPLSTPEGSNEGIVWRNFSLKPQNITGAIFETIDQAFTRCFSRIPGSNADPLDNILRGSCGMDIVIQFFEECARSPKLDSGASHLTELKVGQLTDLVYARIKSLPQDPQDKPLKKRRHGDSRRHKSVRATKALGAKQGGANSSSDSDFSPHSGASGSESGETSSESEGDDAQPDDNLNMSEVQRHKRKRQKTINSMGSTGGVEDKQSHVNPSTNSIICVGRKRGRSAIVREWAFAHHNKPEASFYPNTNRPAWAYKCKYCPSVHHFPPDQEDVSKEKISATNLAGHLKSCEKLPNTVQIDASLGEMFKSANPRPGPIVITPLAFRSVLIQGVVRDNYPLTFGEGRGMQQVFAMVSPNLDLPVHSTMRKDLNKLYKVLSRRVRQVLSAQNSRFAITSDAWTSKSFVYSLGGVVVTFIDKSWNMQEFVLDIVHLDADHTGAGMGRRIFRSLDHMNAARNVIASVTDNASNNRTMNNELLAWLSKKYGFCLNVSHMSVTCLCHALHLVCGAILSNLKAMDPIENDETYSLAKAFEEGEILEQSAEVLEEEERLQGEENKLATHPALVDALDEELNNTETVNQPQIVAILDSQPTQVALGDKLNCVQKVHSIVVDITSSAAHQKQMRTITQALGLELRAVIKSVRVRWNSVLAEIRCAILLKAAINQYVATLDDGKTGALLCRARALKRKWTITDDKGDELNKLVRILEIILGKEELCYTWFYQPMQYFGRSLLKAAYV
ncbi:protein dimerization [Rhizoctonia solani]|uniref:Protein dimerization n=1 Tax=Rhizoctonia solani TaxID=456999 RepID=A0A8H7I8G1_9AGAM|nr:protein dimerization [Rhizoctonia solani]